MHKLSLLKRTDQYLNSLLLHKMLIVMQFVGFDRLLFYEKFSINKSMGSSWKDLPSSKREILHITFTTIHKNN